MDSASKHICASDLRNFQMDSVRYRTDGVGWDRTQLPSENVQFFVVDVIAHREEIEIYKNKNKDNKRLKRL